jgi:AcrR family transcriptional regulator
MGVLERKERQKDEVRAAILKAAWEIANKEGWKAVSLRKIADIIEYSAPLIYSYFECKEAILLEFVKKGYFKKYEALKKAKQQHTDPALQLKAMALAGWEFAIKEQTLYQLMYSIKVAPCKIQWDCCEIIDARKDIAELTLSTIKELIARSAHPETDPEMKYLAYSSILHGLVSFYLTQADNPGAEKYKLILDDAISGIIKTLDQ